MEKEYLFVYGTLRKEYGLKVMNEIADDLIYVGRGNIKAGLFDLGHYPAAVKGAWQTEIKGDVYEIGKADAVFAVLDDYEGEEYKRGTAAVTMANGQSTNAWIYWYTGTVSEEQRIREDDYLNYLQNKKDRFL
jgi:pyruvate carboxylase